jgi:hypothetical protein
LFVEFGPFDPGCLYLGQKALEIAAVLVEERAIVLGAFAAARPRARARALS